MQSSCGRICNLPTSRSLVKAYILIQPVLILVVTAWKQGNHPLSTEIGLRKRGYQHIIGSDESGRGAIAGPVVAASCCIKKDYQQYEPIGIVRDSKLLTEGERQLVYEQVVHQPQVYAWSVSIRSNDEIDNSDILSVTMDCFKESIESIIQSEGFPMSKDVIYSIVDGKKRPKLSGTTTITCRPWVKGDAEVYTVALASIIAKCTRDHFMVEQAHKQYPQYNFAANKGYPLRDHIQAIHTHGACPLHRMRFKPLQGREITVQ